MAGAAHLNVVENSSHKVWRGGAVQECIPPPLFVVGSCPAKFGQRKSANLIYLSDFGLIALA
jgi:hypothetical protein